MRPHIMDGSISAPHGETGAGDPERLSPRYCLAVHLMLSLALWAAIAWVVWLFAPL